jgi:hypothetical protein
LEKWLTSARWEIVSVTILAEKQLFKDDSKAFSVASNMFRSGVDMTDFPALGSVNSSLNQNVSATSPRSSLLSNRFGSYASTAGTSAGSAAPVQPNNRQFDDQFGGYSPQGSAALGGYSMGLHSLPTHHAGNDQSPSTTQQRMSSRTFTADEFPALKGSLYCLINVGKCADQMH